MAKYQNLKEYLTEVFYYDIFKACKSYLYKNERLFNLYTSDIPDPFCNNLADVTVTSLHSENVDKKIIKIIATVRMDINIKGKLSTAKCSDVEEETIYRYVEIIIITKFGLKLEEFQIVDVNHLDEAVGYNRINSSTKNLVPYMEEKHLEIYAENFLNAVYPEALMMPLQLPVDLVAKRLGLTIVYKDLNDDTFGKIYFLDDKNFKIKSKTILIDRRKSFINGAGNTKNTIIHECVHWFYHRRFFELQHLLDSSIKSIICMQVESKHHYDEKYSEDLRWMEWQANSLAPRILMPEKTTRLKFDELYDVYNLEFPHNRVEIYKNILKKMSDVFGVSKQLAKIRLIQLGYTQFIGLDEYIDDDAMSYVVKKDKMNPGDTYRVTYNDFVYAALSNENLRTAIREEKILFVDGFVVLNNPKYVSRVGNSYFMTDYSLNAIDECCLKFKIVHQYKKNIERKYSMCFLCRSNKTFAKSTVRNLAETHTNDELIDEALETFLEDDAVDNEMISNMNYTFNKAFKYLYDYYEIPSDNYIAKLCGLDHKTIASYMNDTAKEPHYKTVLAICSGLCLRPRVAKKLLSTIGKDLSISPLTHDHLYEILIDTKYNLGLEVWNKLIKKTGLDDRYLLP